MDIPDREYTLQSAAASIRVLLEQAPQFEDDQTLRDLFEMHKAVTDRLRQEFSIEKPMPGFKLHAVK